jgi:hypothetical protein
MICVFDVIQGPALGKRIWLRENQCMEVGRALTSDFSIASDAHLSRRHLLLDSTGGSFRVRDMGSSNGTFVNEQRVSVSELKSGDVLRAGLSTFRVSFQERDANPHEKDGIVFNPSLQELPKSGAESLGGRRTIDFSGASDLEATVKFPPNRGMGPASPHFSGQNDLLGGVAQPSQSMPAAKGVGAEGIGVEGVGVEGMLEQHFRSKGPGHLFELVQTLQAPQGDFQAIVDSLAAGRPVTVVINETQLDPQVALEVRQFGGAFGFTGVSQTLLAGRFELSPALWALLEKCMRQDALICLGGPSILTPEFLKPYCNSLSYPSMFGIHMGDAQSPLCRYLLEHKAFAVFEWNRAGTLGLFH